MAICSECQRRGRPCEYPDYYITSRGVCQGCMLDGYVPRGHRGREDYVYDEVYQHENASAKPATGVDLLDCHRTRYERRGRLPRRSEAAGCHLSDYLIWGLRAHGVSERAQA